MPSDYFQDKTERRSDGYYYSIQDKMKKQNRNIYFLLFLLLHLSHTTTLAQEENKLYKEFDIEINSDYRYFYEEGLYNGQKDHYFSLAVKPEVYLEWADGAQLLKFTGFARWEQHNSRRTHADIRELYWQLVKKNWEFSVGLKKVFWGVTESIHLVDVINQTDAVESFDGEAKLGQPMLHFSYLTSIGTFDLMAMPYFRKRQFPGREGRFRFPLLLEKDAVGFENEDLKAYYPSFALRWSNTLGPFDMGLSHFYGVGREPVFISNEDNSSFNVLYPINHQTGIDLQAITGPALWKFESLLRLNDYQNVFALALGVEYTFGNIANSGIDIGILGEYLYDDRDELALSGMDNDAFFGSRIAFNDIQSTEILFGGIFDLKRSTKLFSMEASRRFGESWKFSLEARILTSIAEEEFFNFFRNDSFVKTSLSKFF